MANTYSFISKVSGGAGGTASVEFTSIPSTYTDLKLVFSGKTNNNSWVSYILEINTSASNLSQQQLTGNGTNISTSANTSQTFIANTFSGATNAGFSVGEIYIANYSSSNAKKILQTTGSSIANQTTAYTGIIGATWVNGSAINQIKIGEVGATIQQYTTVYLYGIKNSV